MDWNASLRHTHRWLSVAFTLSVIFTSVALARDAPAMWVNYVPLGPLALLFLTGGYLFVLPYLARRRRA